jgi:hypothetical protein
MTTRELIIRARNSVEKARESSTDGLLSPEMLLMELMASSLEYHLIMHTRMQLEVHDQIVRLKDLIIKPS